MRSLERWAGLGGILPEPRQLSPAEFRVQQGAAAAAETDSCGGYRGTAASWGQTGRRRAAAPGAPISS